MLSVTQQPGHQIVYFNWKLLYPFFLFLFDVFDDISIWIVRELRFSQLDSQETKSSDTGSHPRRTKSSEYEVWQKSNAIDFLLTMKFILFTNQGYPLQNSSLGQVHSDGGVVFIVRSSAGRLLLEYLSARRLRSSGY
jgi:hypothetical protein